jgi:HYR domain
MVVKTGLNALAVLVCILMHSGWCRGDPTHEPTAAPTNLPTKPPTKSPTIQTCVADTVPPDITCPSDMTLLQMDVPVRLPSFLVQTVSQDFCGVASKVQTPAPGTVLAVNTTTQVNITVTDPSKNANVCPVLVTVKESSLLYQTTFQIAGGRSERQSRQFSLPTESTGYIQAVTGTLSTNLYYYSEVIRSVLSVGSTPADPNNALLPDRLLIQWRGKYATLVYADTNYVNFTNDTVFSLALSSNYITSPYAVTYRVYGHSSQ